MLRKAPGFTLAAVLATALGIGANTAIFTVIKQVLLQPLPYPDAGRIVDVNEYARERATAVSPPNFIDWRAGNRTLTALGAYTDQIVTLTGASEPVRVGAALFDPAVLQVLGVPPLLGRPSPTTTCGRGRGRSPFSATTIWQRAYGGDRAILSQTITLEGEPHEVVGVMPAGFDFPGETELWMPLAFGPRDLGDNQRGAHYLAAVGRLRPGVSAAQASADLDRIEQGIAARFPDKLNGYSVAAVPLLTRWSERSSGRS